MATSDQRMNQYLTTIAEAVHGRDMRSAIHDGLEYTFTKAFEWADQTLGNANRALQKATEALSIATGFSDDIQEVKDLGQELQDEYDETVGRIDNIIAHNQDTQGNTELIDIRTTYKGYTSTSAGSAVRLQARELSSRMDQIVRTFPTTQVSANMKATPEYEQLWTNESQSSFVTQSITLEDFDFGNISELLVLFYDSTSEFSETNPKSKLIPLVIPDGSAETQSLSEFMATAANTYSGTYGICHAYRDMKAAISGSDLTVLFGSCNTIITNNPFSLSNTDMTITDLSATISVDDSKLIPVAIYALKYAIKGQLTVSKDSEITDARVGVDGTVYNTLGEAIRTQISQYTASEIIAALNDEY